MYDSAQYHTPANQLQARTTQQFLLSETNFPERRQYRNFIS